MIDPLPHSSPEHLSQFSDVDWVALIETIQNDQCVLIFGPDISIPDGEESPLAWQLANEFAALLKDELPPKEFGKISPDNLPQTSLFYSHIKGGDIYPRTIARSFFKKKADKSSSLHKNLAELPFRTVITSAHDEMFLRALESKGKAPKVHCYNFNGNQHEAVAKGTIESPMVYYLYGHPRELQSLVLTESDLLDFLVKVIKGRPELPDNILSMFASEKKCYLFLGFGFRNWYLRILMHVMQKNKKTRSIAMEKVFQKRLKEFQSTVLFFKKSRHNIHIFNMELNQFAETLKNKYCERFPDGQEISPDQTPSPDAPVAFISHARENRKEATALCNQLNQKGISAWIDWKDLYAGDDFDFEIKKAIKDKIDYFIFLNSSELADRNEGYVIKELNAAIDRQEGFKKGLKFIIPITFDNTKAMDEYQKLNQISLPTIDDIDPIVSAIRRDQERRKRG
jgi:hypothetical protein